MITFKLKVFCFLHSFYIRLYSATPSRGCTPECLVTLSVRKTVEQERKMELGTVIQLTYPRVETETVICCGSNVLFENHSLCNTE